MDPHYPSATAPSPPPRRRPISDQDPGAAVSLPDTKAVASWLNCSELTVEKLRKSGRLPYVVVCDRLIRFLPADIESYLQRNRRVAQPEAVA